MKIYGVPISSHLGDVWIIISGAILLSKSSKEKIYISRYGYGDNDFKTDINFDFKERILMCIEALDTNGAELEIVDQEQNFYNSSNQTERHIIPWTPYFCHNPPVPTKIKHSPKNENIISIQLSSLNFDFSRRVYFSHLGNWLNDYRNIPSKQLELIYANLLSFDNLKLHFVGAHDGELINSVKKIAESKIFIGIDSGMSHIASSVGLPVYLYDWEKDPSHKLINWHTNKNVNVFKNMEDIVQILKKHQLI